MKTLSDEIKQIAHTQFGINFKCFSEEDVKKFIKDLKEILAIDGFKSYINRNIDKLAGEKLI